MKSMHNQHFFLTKNFHMMKKLPALMLSWLAAASATMAAPVFTTELNTQEEFDLWTVKDVNKDGATWQFSPDNDPGKRTYYSYHGTNVADDWLISPAITPDEEATYIVRYSFLGSSYGESMNVYMATSPDIDILKNNLKAEYPEILGNDADGYFLFEGKAGQPIYIGFYACSKPDKFRLYLKSVTVERCDNPVDIAVTEIVSPASGEGLSDAETLTVKVKNCGLAAVSTFTLSAKVDGKEVLSEYVEKAIAPGETAEISANGKLDLSISHHNYNVEVTAAHPDDIAPSNNTYAAKIRHIGPAAEPYFMGFEPDEDTSGITFVDLNADLNNDSGNWGIEIGSSWINLARTGFGCLGYNYDKQNNADDWAFLDGVQVEAGHHVLKFWLSGDDNHPERLSVHYGNAAAPEAMTNELIRFDPFQQGAYQEVICIFEVKEPQTVFIGFHAFSDKDENWITIDDVSLEKISATESDIKIDRILAPGEYLPKTAAHSVDFTVRNIGIVDAQTTFKLYANGSFMTSLEKNIKAQEILDLTFPDALASLAPGNYELKVELESDVDTKPENNVMTMNVRVLGDPDILYDFESESQLEDLTFRSEDSNTLAPGAINEFGEEGYGIMKIESHDFYGLAVLGCSTWFTSSTAKADRWLVFPKMKVNSSDACFVWNAGSANELIDEAYRAMVSEKNDVWSDYNKLLDVPSEGTTRANRGIDLSSYEGKNIFVALNIKTQNGDCLTFDNCGFYGCEKATSGIGSVIGDASGMSVEVAGDRLAISGVDSAEIEVYDLSGVAVLSTEGNEADLSSLAPGFYVARVVAGKAAVSVKFVRN